MTTVRSTQPVDKRVMAVRKAGRRLGYLIAIVVNAGFLLAVTVGDLDERLDFVTEDFSRVSGYVVASLVVSLLVYVAFLAYDPPWFKSLGQICSNLFGVIAVARLWSIFPFDYADHGVDWTPLTRIVLAVVIGGGTISLLAELVKLLFGATPSEPERPR